MKKLNNHTRQNLINELIKFDFFSRKKNSKTTHATTEGGSEEPESDGLSSSGGT